MHPDSASLSSAATTVDDIIERVTAVADRLRGGDHDDVAVDLYEAERSLQAARRRLSDAVRALGRPSHQK